MRNKKLLAIILLSLSFCFVFGAGAADTNTVGSSHPSASSIRSQGFGDVDTSDVGETWAEELKRRIQASQLPERYTFFFIPVEGVIIEFWTFLDMYPDAEIPEEFALILPSEINNVDKMKKNRGFSFYSDFKIYGEFILSLLLTMAYQQGYEVEHVTSSYVILAKSVYEEELEEWEERLNEYREKGENNAKNNSSD